MTLPQQQKLVSYWKYVFTDYNSVLHSDIKTLYFFIFCSLLNWQEIDLRYKMWVYTIYKIKSDLL